MKLKYLPFLLFCFVLMDLFLGSCNNSDTNTTTSKNTNINYNNQNVVTKQQNIDSLNIGTTPKDTVYKWFTYVNKTYNFSFKVPCSSTHHSETCENGKTPNLIWQKPIKAASEKGLLCYLNSEEGIRIYIFDALKTKLPNGDTIPDFSEYGKRMYNVNEGKYKTPNSLYVNTIPAFSFTAPILFDTLNTYQNLESISNLNAIKNTLNTTETQATVVLFTVNNTHFRVIYDPKNPIAKKIFTSLQFYGQKNNILQPPNNINSAKKDTTFFSNKEFTSLTFSAAKTQNIVNGTIIAFSNDRYIFEGKLDKLLQIKLTSPNKALKFVLSQLSQPITNKPTTEYNDTIKSTDKYIIIVKFDHEAAKKKQKTEYTLQINQK